MQRTHELSIMGAHYLHDIISGKKKYEGRVYAEKCRIMQVGDILKLDEKMARWGIVCHITSINPFATFKEMLDTLGVLNLLPQLEPQSRVLPYEAFISEAIHVYTSFPGSERVASFGCVAIGVQFLHRYGEYD